MKIKDGNYFIWWCGFASYLNNVLGSRVLIYINCEKSKFYSLSNYIVFFFLCISSKHCSSRPLLLLPKLYFSCIFLARSILIEWLDPSPTVSRHFLRVFIGPCYWGARREARPKPWNREAGFKVPRACVLCETHSKFPVNSEKEDMGCFEK